MPPPYPKRLDERFSIIFTLQRVQDTRYELYFLITFVFFCTAFFSILYFFLFMINYPNPESLHIQVVMLVSAVRLLGTSCETAEYASWCEIWTIGLSICAVPVSHLF
jgi:hypothetical protein